MKKNSKRKFYNVIAYFLVFSLFWGSILSVDIRAEETTQSDQAEASIISANGTGVKDRKEIGMEDQSEEFSEKKPEGQPEEAEENKTEESAKESPERLAEETKEMIKEPADTEIVREPRDTKNMTETENGGEAVKILLVGNSFTKNGSHSNGRTVQSQLKKMVSASGKKALIKTVAHGGAKLKYYAGMTEEKKAYKDELLAALQSEKWDYVVLQEYSSIPYLHYEEDMVPAVEWIQKKINKMVPEATILLYMTHGYDYTYKNENGKKVTLSAHDLVCHVGAAYTRLGKKSGMDVIPVGIHFYRASLKYPEIRLIGADNKHPTAAGYFLAASCIYQKIFRELPILNKDVFDGAGITRKQGESLVGLIGKGIESGTIEKNMQVGDSVTLKVHSIRGENISKVRFSSLNEEVAQIGNKSGRIKAVGKGQAVLVAETPDGQLAFCTVYVTDKRPQNVTAEIYDRQGRNSNKVQVKLSWSTVKGASYHVYRASSKNGSYKLLATVKNSRYIDKTATVGRTWYYRITATDGTRWESRNSGVVKVTPLKVKNLKIKVTGESKAKLSWKKNSKAAGYAVYRSASKNGSYKKIAEITSKQKNYYIDSNRKQEKTYYYKVIACGKE